jgi:hypothetical protein
MQQLLLPDNVIPLFGYCLRGCGRPATRRVPQPNGDIHCLCDDEPNCRQKARELYMPAYCDPANEVRGNLYDRDLDVKEIAKRMRQAIKAELPGVKVSVKIQRYSGGASIDVWVKEMPCDCQPIIPRQQWHEERDRTGILRPWRENYKPEMAAAMDKIKEIHGRWNRDNSDTMVDYFDVNYYGSVHDPNGTSW